MLAGMPEPADLSRSVVDGRVVISVGATVLFDYDASDAGLRNIAAVTLPELGFTGRRVAEVLGITEEYVSMLRGRTRRDGSAALLARRGRPQSLRPADLAKARRARADGDGDTVIGRRLGVHATTVARALARSDEAARVTPPAHYGQPTLIDADTTEIAATEIDTTEIDTTEIAATEIAATETEIAPTFSGSSRIESAVVRSRYGGAMLLHAYLDRVGAEAIFSSLRGAPARRYDDLAILTAATVGFALGISTVEGAKHLVRREAGAVVGAEAIPELSSLRARLGALGDGSDPLALQRNFAAGMLSFDAADDPVYFVDDHFVAYSGAKPVPKGWNTKRRHACPGRDDTFIVDARGRAVVFSSADPTGLSSTLPGVLAQLRAVTGPEAKILLGFDRGGAYPVAFKTCRQAGADWVTYRRAPLAPVSATPKRSWTLRDGKRITVVLADETVEISNYGTARQLTLYEHGEPVLQVLTSDLTATGASLLCWLRARWRIENMFKYAVAHNGIDALCDYVMDIVPNTAMVANPARAAARARVKAAEAALALAERALPQLLAGPGTPAEMNAALPELHRRIQGAASEVEQAKSALRPIPAKIAATDIDADAVRAHQRLERRGLQMVLRLLAFNAEAWLAEHLNAYLADRDEYRAILRNLLHLAGTVTFDATTISVILDRPDSPRVARSLELLAEELSVLTAHLPGDPRPLTYHVAQARV
jgi:transposase